MLQTPSSILSFSSLSKALVGLLGGFCIGAQITASIVLPGLVQVPNLKKLLHASPTLEIVLIPTKCVPSSGDVSLPYVAVVAYATIVFTGLFCILRAKGFSSRSGSQPSDIPRPFRASNLRAQPPSPPPEPGSSGSTAKPRRRTRWIHWLLLLIVFLLGAAALYLHLVDSDLPAGLHGDASHWFFLFEHNLLAWQCAVESYMSRVKIYISLRGLHHLRFLLLVTASYPGLILVPILSKTVLRRLRRLIPGPSYRQVQPDPFHRILCIALASAVIMTFCPYFNLIVWVWFFFEPDNPAAGYGLEYPGLEAAVVFCCPSSFIEVWHNLSLIERLIFVGPTAVHILLAVLSWSIRASAAGIRLLIHTVRDEPWDALIDFGSLFAGVYTCTFLVCYPSFAFDSLDRQTRSLVSEQPFLSRNWRSLVCEVYWMLAGEYRAWKLDKVHELQDRAASLPEILAEAFYFGWERWSTICLVEKLLIVVPTTVFYGYFYLLPAARRIRAIFRRWGWRR